MPFILLAYLVIEKAILGWRRSIIAGFGIGALLCLLTGTAPYSEVWAIEARIVLNDVFIIVSPYTVELYPTEIEF